MCPLEWVSEAVWPCWSDVLGHARLYFVDGDSALSGQ